MNRTRDKYFKECVIQTISKIPDRYLGQLLISINQRYEYHLSLAHKNRDRYRIAHYFLSFAIPLYSAFFTYITSNDIITSGRALGAIGLVLTIMTIVASILKPHGRFIAAAQELIDLNTWKTDFIDSLGTLMLKIDNNDYQPLYGLLKRKDLEMSKIGGALLDLVLTPSTGKEADGQ